jgi:hypothetical protein
MKIINNTGMTMSWTFQSPGAGDCGTIPPEAPPYEYQIAPGTSNSFAFNMIGYQSFANVKDEDYIEISARVLSPRA